MRYQKLDKITTPTGFSGKNKIKVQLWFIFSAIFFSTSPLAFNWLRVFILNSFGANVSYRARIRPSVRVFYPWNISVGDYTYIADRVNLYSLDKISIGSHCSISMDATICTGTHEKNRESFDLITKPIIIENESWIAAGAFISHGCCIGRGAIVGARSYCMPETKIAEAEIWVGSPAKKTNNLRVVNE